MHSEFDTNQNRSIMKLIKAFERAKTSMEYLKAEYDELGAGLVQDFKVS